MLEIVCNGKVHYRRPHNHPDVLELLKQMAEGKADGYSIRSASSNSHYEKCAEAIYSSTFSSKEIFTVEKIVQILKAHFK